MNTQSSSVPDNTICLQQDFFGKILNSTAMHSALAPQDAQAKVSLMNELALAGYAKGDYKQAERYLEAALMQLSFQQEETTFISSKTQRQDKPVPEPSKAENDPTSMVATNTRTATDPRSLYIYQREMYDEGMRMYQQPLSLQCDADSSKTKATLWYNLGQTQIQLAKIQDGKTAFESALQSTNDTISSGSYLHYVTLHNLGYCCYRLGDNEGALQHLQAALDLVEQQMGSTEQDQLSSLDLAASYNCVAVLLFHAFGSARADALQKSLDLFQIALDHYMATLGGNNAQVATVLSNMGRIYFLVPNYTQAMEYFQKSLSLRTSLLGPQSLDVMTCLFNIAGTYHKERQLKKAQDYYQRFVHSAALQFQGRPHRDYAAALLALADIATEQDRVAEAAKLLDQATRTARAALGARHPDMVLFFSRQGNICFVRKQYDQALQSYEECLATQQCFLPESHSSILVTLLNIARISKQCGRYHDAFVKYSDIYAIQTQALGPSHPETASTVFNMGLMKYICEDHLAALSFYQEALRMRRDLSESSTATQEHHLDTAAVLNSIGLSLFKLNHMRLAKDAFVECLRIRREIHGPVHREIATMLYNLATIHMDMGEDDEALLLYRESLSVEKQALGEHHLDISLTLQHLAGMHQERGELDQALSYFEQALEIERFHATNATRASKKDRQLTAVGKLLNLIGNLHLMMGRVDAMMKSYQESCRLGGQGGHDLVIAGLNFYGLSKLHPPCAPIA